jgi:hypothetical protein
MNIADASPSLCPPSVRMVVVVGYPSLGLDTGEPTAEAVARPVVAITAYRDEAGRLAWDAVFSATTGELTGRITTTGEYDKAEGVYGKTVIVDCPWDHIHDREKLAPHFRAVKAAVAKAIGANRPRGEPMIDAAAAGADR